MKNLLIALLLLPFMGVAQTIENIDYISPFHNDLAAIKKGNKWAFINKEGETVIDFRNDFVSTNINNVSYPLFYNDRCLIEQIKDGVSYFGYIDKSGKTIIKPQFLNATNFNKGKALALKVKKEIIGYNNIFRKNMVNYHYFEVVIDTEGNMTDHLTQLAIHTPPKPKSKKPIPIITSKLISKNLVAVKRDNKWVIKKITY
mgnify:FL=1|tara:strand:- start:3626 stop:4228 length:603 start_codon:yes stop_codon:yes gene_type:complete